MIPRQPLDIEITDADGAKAYGVFMSLSADLKTGVWTLGVDAQQPQKRPAGDSFLVASGAAR
ncbi:hypothetical protein CA13_22320 [Planctomycetes bacterium CA13]|uniref:Uncharacterized protein n=1 Tax=Novipirellula herctigrandis TaxID=2527986 RepID=A0A5C5Z187_9BACT|nr:hypothetical protein CA13_22320 [Planctomycetes bacterium CA13]